MNTLILQIHELDPARRGYPVSVHTWSENGLEIPVQANGLIAVDLSAPGLAAPFSGEALRSLWAQAAGQEPDLLIAGAQMYALVARSGIGNILESDDQRIILDIRAPELQCLPWELMNTPDGGLRFGDANRPLCRGRLTDGPALPPLEWPLRLMIVMACNPDDGEVKPAAEMEALLDALIYCDPDVDLHVLKQPSKSQIVEEAQRFKPHIFHFIGHGRVNGKSAWLDLMQKDGVTLEAWTTESIRNDDLGKPLRLVFLNACRSSGVRETGLPSITEVFLKRGVPAVVGMTSDVNGADAGHFAGRFYRSLAEGNPVDVAIAEARQAVWEQRVDGTQRREWAAPCLHVQNHPEQVLNIAAFRSIEPQWRKAVPTMRDYKKNRIFVDRRDERYLTWQGIADAAAQLQTPGLMVIQGESGVGKSEFTKILLERCFIYGYDILYVDLDKYMPGGTMSCISVHGLNFLTVLRAIRDAGVQASGGLRRSFPRENFYSFNRKVNEILRKSGTPCPDPGQSEEQQAKRDLNLDQWKTLSAEGNIEAKRKQFFDSFRPCLEQCATERPLVIALDQWERLYYPEFELIYEGLFDYYSEHAQIRFVLPLNLTNYESFKLANHRDQFYLVQMDSFAENLWDELAVEYILRYRRFNKAFGSVVDERRYTDQARERIPQIRQRLRGPWKPNSFAQLVIEVP